MNKTLTFNDETVPFVIKNISAKQMNAILKKRRGLFGVINTISATEDIVFESLVFPVFDTKELMLEGMTPGQYIQLAKEVFTLNGFKEDNENG